MLLGGRAMFELRPVLRLALVAFLPIALGGCPLAIVGGLAAAGGAGYAANQERGVGGTADDLAIKTNIQNAWLQVNPLMQRDFSVTVYEGRTLLTGTPPNPELSLRRHRSRARSRAFGRSTTRSRWRRAKGPWQGVRDTWISAQIRSNLVFSSQVRSVNYTIDTVNGSVYLIGSARTQAELDRVTDAAGTSPMSSGSSPMSRSGRGSRSPPSRRRRRRQPRARRARIRPPPRRPPLWRCRNSDIRRR